jgi:hypothetical protein
MQQGQLFKIQRGPSLYLEELLQTRGGIISIFFLEEP